MTASTAKMNRWKRFFYKTPLGEDSLFGDSKMRSENRDVKHLNSNPWIGEGRALSSYDNSSDYFSYSGLSAPNGERASRTTSGDFAAATFPSSLSRSLYRSISNSLKTPLDEDSLFGGSKTRPQNHDVKQMSCNPCLCERMVRSSYSDSLGPTFPGSSPGSFPGSSAGDDYLDSFRLVDERQVLFTAHPSYSDFSALNRKGASITSSGDVAAGPFPSSHSKSPRGPVSDSALQTCNICAEDRQPSEFPVISTTSTCTHPVTDTCKECIRRHLASQLSSRGTAMLYCICNQPLSLDEVQQNADPVDFARYSERATMELLESDSQFIWCPAQGCGAGQIQQRGSDEPKVTCAQCRQPYCFIHRVRWHAGMTCREFDQAPELADTCRAIENAQTHDRRLERESEALSNQQREALKVAAREKREREAQERENECFVRRNARPCPNCRYMTQKDGGCKHMTCRFKNDSSYPIERANCCN